MSLKDKKTDISLNPHVTNYFYHEDDVHLAVEELNERIDSCVERGQFNKQYFKALMEQVFG